MDKEYKGIFLGNHQDIDTIEKVYKYAKAKNFYNCCKQYKVMDKWQSCLLAYDWKSLYFQHCEF